MSAEPDPAATVAALEARARRVETPCGEGTMAWRVWGEGPPLALVHGAQGSWLHWIRNIDALAAHFTVLAADLPGQGDSALPATPDHAGISRALADGLRQIADGEPVALVGFSFGGVCSAFCAALHPDVVRRLVLVGTGGLDTPRGEVSIGRVSGLRGEAREAALNANLLGLMLRHPDSADALARHILVAGARGTRMVDPAMVLPDKLLRVLPDIAAPVGAIWGELDRPHPDPAAQEAAIRSVRPDCDFRVIPGAGHWAMYERAEVFNATLLDMLLP